MSTLKELSESKVTIVIKPKENILQSFVRDLITFSMMGLCIYVSQGSTLWTFITGLMFLLFMGVKLSSIVNKSMTTFEDKKAAIKYIEDLDI